MLATRRSVSTRCVWLALSAPLALTAGCENLLGLRKTAATRDVRAPATAGAVQEDDAGASGAAGSNEQRSGSGGRTAGPSGGAGGIAGSAGSAGSPDAKTGGGSSGGHRGGTGGNRSASGGSGASAGTDTLDGGGAGLAGSAGSDEPGGSGGEGLGGTAGAAAGGAGTGGFGGSGQVLPGGAIIAADQSCLAIAQTQAGAVSDATAVHGNCDDDPAQRWAFDADGHLYAGVDDAVLEVNGDTGASGAIVRVAAAVVPAADNQQWTFDGVQMVNLGGLCVDVPFGNFFDGANVQVFGCNNGASQSFSVTALGQIRHASYCLDLPASNTADGTRLQMFTCHDDAADNQRFTLEHGRLEPWGTSKCLGVAGDPTVEQTALEVQPCDTNSVGQSFHLVGPIMNGGQCLDSGSAGVGLGDPVTLEPCAGTVQQTWIWAF
jgi:hypothetical protein